MHVVVPSSKYYSNYKVCFPFHLIRVKTSIRRLLPTFIMYLVDVPYVICTYPPVPVSIPKEKYCGRFVWNAMVDIILYIFCDCIWNGKRGLLCIFRSTKHEKHTYLSTSICFHPKIFLKWTLVEKQARKWHYYLYVILFQTSSTFSCGAWKLRYLLYCDL